MSWYDYKRSQEITLKSHPFYALIMAAMRDADTRNLRLLRECWPDVWAELEERYWAPNGELPTDHVSETVTIVELTDEDIERMG